MFISLINIRFYKFMSKETINVVNDQIGSLTSCKSLADTCWELISIYSNNVLSKNLPNILHWSDEGLISWFQIACEINTFSAKIGLIEKEKEIIKEELKNLGKAKEIAEKISLGKINKFKEDNSLLTQDWVMDPKLKVKDIMNKVDSKSLKIKDFVRIKIGE